MRPLVCRFLSFTHTRCAFSWFHIVRNHSSRTMIDHLQYSIEVPAEEISLYCPGGYHPIHIGDFLRDGRYHILQKLGFGSFSTVWLARDNLYATSLTIMYSACLTSLLGTYLTYL